MRSNARRTRRLLSLGFIVLVVLAFQPAALAQRPSVSAVGTAPRIDPRSKIHPNLLKDMTAGSGSALRAGPGPPQKLYDTPSLITG